jgi:RES domain-containing protein
MQAKAGKQTLFKAVYVDYEKEPLPSRSRSGRFHDEKTGMNTTYLTPNKATAWKEVTLRWKADPAYYRMAEVEAKLDSVVDLTDPKKQKEYGISKEALLAADYRLTQQLARQLRSEGVQAAWSYSFADQPDGRMLVVFMENVERPNSYVRVKRVEKIGS